MIAVSKGDTSHSYIVVQDGEAVGMVEMTNLVEALVPRIASEPGARNYRPSFGRRRGMGALAVAVIGELILSTVLSLLPVPRVFGRLEAGGDCPNADRQCARGRERERLLPEIKHWPVPDRVSRHSR